MALEPGRGMARLALLAVLLSVLAASQLPTSHGEPGAATPQNGDSKDAQQWTGPLSLDWDQTPPQTVETGPVSFAFSAVDTFGLPCGDCVYSCHVSLPFHSLASHHMVPGCFQGYQTSQGLLGRRQYHSR